MTPRNDILRYLSFAFRLTSCSVITSRIIYGAAKSSVSVFCTAHIPLCTWITSSLNIHLLMGILFASMSWLLWRLLQCTFAILCLLDSGLLRCRAQRWACWIEWYLNFYFETQFLCVLIIGSYFFTPQQQLEGTEFSKTSSAFSVCRLFAEGHSSGVCCNLFIH